jgi:tRNA(His) 5'-end guanylyltransferase
MDNTLVGKTVEYNFTPDNLKRGTVMERVEMFEQRKEKESDKEKKTFRTTGFMIVDDNGKIDSVAYWRVKSVVND